MIIMASIGQRVRFVKLHSIAWYRLALYSIAWYPTWFLLQVHKIYKNQLFSIIDGIPNDADNDDEEEEKKEVEGDKDSVQLGI